MFAFVGAATVDRRLHQDHHSSLRVCVRGVARSMAYSFGLLVVCMSHCLFAQTNDVDQKGVPANGVFSGGDVDMVNLQNGNLHISIPIVSLKQRGGSDLSFQLVYDTQSWLRLWVPNNCGLPRCTPAGYWVVEQNPNVASSWRLTSSLDYSLDYTDTTVTCATTGIEYEQYTNWVVIDPQGGKHPTALREEIGTNCLGQVLSGPTLDGSGYTLDSSGTIRAKNGAILGNFKDANGNYMNTTNDTLGRNPVTTEIGPTITYTTPLGGQTVGPAYTKYTITDSNGNAETYEEDYQAIDETSDICAHTLGGAGCTDANQVPVLVDKQFVLPNGKAYVFKYANNTPGDLQELDLPTGAAISYTYGDYYQAQWGPNNRYTLHPNSSGGRTVATRTVTLNGVPSVWTYSLTGGGLNASVIDPLGNQKLSTFNSVVANGNLPYPTANTYDMQDVYEDPVGHVLKTVTRTFVGDPDNANQNVINVRETSETVTLDNGLQSQKQTDYETFTYSCSTCDTSAGVGIGIATRLNPTEVRYYDFGANGPGALLKRVDYSYLHNSNSAYLNLNIVDRATSVTTYDGSGNQVAQTLNEFDNYNHSNQPMLASNAIQHDSGYGTSYTARGNITATSVWRNTDGAYLTATFQYDDAGNKLSAIDPGGHQTSYHYDDSWSNASCGGAGQTKAYLTQVTNAKGQSSYSRYNSCTGSIAGTTDTNGQSTTMSYGLMDRVMQIAAPDGGTKTYCYSDNPNGSCPSATLYMTEVDSLSSSVNSTTETLFDGMGRPTQTQLQSDPNGTAYVDTQYDALGRAYKVSNPYRSGDTEYWTTQLYDAIGRSAGVSKQDGSSTSITYSGNVALSQDEAGKQRKTQTDALGRITTVWEDPAGVNYETDYGYDGLGNLQTVTQKGGDGNSGDWRIRTFTYNSLSQLLCSANPEIGVPGAALATCPTTDNGSYITGTVRYQYNNDGELVSKIAPLPNQSGTSSVTTSYTYDSLHRVTSTTYSDGSTPAVYSAYDGDSLSNCTVPSLGAANSIGHLTAMCDGSGAAAWNFDTMGRTAIEARRIGSVTDQIGYAYYRNGSIATVTYPKAGSATPFSVTYTINGAGRIDSAVGSDSVTYAQVSSTWATGVPHVWQLGSNIQLQDSYNSRLQPFQTTATQMSPNNTLFNRTYDFHAGSGDNGLLYGVVDGMDQLGLPRPNGSVQYTYDSLNRVAGAATSGNDCTSESGGTKDWGQSYSVDPWGNLIAKTVTKCTASTLSTNTDNRNRLAAASYDSAGNVINRSGMNFVYDAEGRLISGGGSSYIYDGQGERVAKPGVLYWKGVGSEALMETSTSDTNPTAYIFFNGKRIARRDFPSQVDIRFPNDSCSGCSGNPQGGGDRNLYVGSAIIGSTNIPVTDSSVSYNSQPCNALSPDGSFLSMLCNGDMFVSTSTLSPNVGANAWGSPDYNVYPTMQLYINNSLAGQWTVTNSSQQYNAQSIYYYVTDMLGSANLVLNSQGGIGDESYFYPYGEEGVVTQSLANQHYKYTGKERDGETGLDDFGARYYASDLGRFMSPDWDAKPTAVPYASFGDPQTLNLYAYVENAPLNKVDADGHVAAGSAGASSASNLITPINDEMDACILSSPTGCDGDKLEGELLGSGYETEADAQNKQSQQTVDNQRQATQEAAQPTNEQIRAELTSLATSYGVPSSVVLAVAKTESNFIVDAVNDNLNKKGEITSTDYGVMQVNSKNIGGTATGADGKPFTITDSIKTDWKANANAGVAIVAQEYRAANKSQPHGTAESRAQQTYSGYNAGPGGRSRYTETGPFHGFADKRDYNFLMNYRSQ